jgi:hypothetical protein
MLAEFLQKNILIYYLSILCSMCFITNSSLQREGFCFVQVETFKCAFFFRVRLPHFVLRGIGAVNELI